MTTSRYNTITTLCVVIAVAATLIFDQFSGSRVLASIMGIAAAVVAAITYFYNRSFDWGEENDSKANDSNVVQANSSKEQPPASKDRTLEEGIPIAWRVFEQQTLQTLQVFLRPAPPPVSEVMELVRGLMSIEADAEYEVSTGPNGLNLRIRRFSKASQESDLKESPINLMGRSRGTIIFH